jgi:hypothetical protein
LAAATITFRGMGTLPYFCILILTSFSVATLTSPPDSL